MRIALGQINTTVGDFSGNTEKVLGAMAAAREQQCAVVVFPEMTLLGYPASDLLLSADFLAQQKRALKKIQMAARDIAVVIGCVEENATRGEKKLRNGASVFYQQRLISTHHKILIPTYDVFDEGRYFAPGGKTKLAKIKKDMHLGISVCEDIWAFEGFAEQEIYARNPTREIAKQKPDVILNLSASPFHVGKPALRKQLICGQAKRHKVPIVYVNLVGGNDGLIFDGGSFAVNAKGEVLAAGKPFAEDLVIVDTTAKKPTRTPALGEEESVFSALTLGLKDYVAKCGFSKVLLGLSGGIDSALVAVLAKAALGAENILAVAMPSRYSAAASFNDAALLAKNLGLELLNISIEEPFTAMLHTLQPAFANKPANVAEENLQARIRGTLLMALSNKHGHLVLTTGNKSEMAVGYCTLYGDMNGGLAVIGDVPKTMVYRLCHWINRTHDIIPKNILTKAPSAELRPNQTDQDTLPSYENLDAILKAYVEDNLEPKAIARKTKLPPAMIEKVLRLVNGAEYKRRQAAPTLRITTKAFGAGRRLPIARKY